MKAKFFSLLTAVLAVCSVSILTSCNDDDKPALPWVGEAVKPVLSGYVTTNNGAALQGATISVNGQTATSDAAGAYTITDLSEGTATVTVSMGSDYSVKTGSIELKNDVVSTFNATLIKANTNVKEENKVDDPTTNTSDVVDAVYSVQTPSTTKEVAENQTQTSTVVIENKSEVFEDEDDDIILAASIDVNEGATKASSIYNGVSILEVATKSGKALKKAIKVAIKSEVAPTKTTINGKTVEISKGGDYYYFNTTELGTVNFAYDINVSNIYSTEGISFSTSVIEGPVKDTTVGYTYKAGSIVDGKSAQLLNFASLIISGTGVKSENGTAEVSDVASGVSVMLTGYQLVNNTSYSFVKLPSAKVSITNYGSVMISRKDIREHTGGSN